MESGKAALAFQSVAEVTWKQWHGKTREVVHPHRHLFQASLEQRDVKPILSCF